MRQRRGPGPAAGSVRAQKTHNCCRGSIGLNTRKGAPSTRGSAPASRGNGTGAVIAHCVPLKLLDRNCHRPATCSSQNNHMPPALSVDGERLSPRDVVGRERGESTEWRNRPPLTVSAGAEMDLPAPIRCVVGGPENQELCSLFHGRWMLVVANACQRRARPPPLPIAKGLVPDSQRPFRACDRRATERRPDRERAAGRPS